MLLSEDDASTATAIQNWRMLQVTSWSAERPMSLTALEDENDWQLQGFLQQATVLCLSGQ